MRKSILTLLLTVTLLAGLAPLAGPAWAQEGEAGYRAGALFTTDPEDSNTEASVFSPDDEAVYAWIFVAGVGGVKDRKFLVDIKFYAPDGLPVASDWYGGDDFWVTATNEQVTPESIARKVLPIAGTDAAEKIGQWKVEFYVNRRLFSIENFTLGEGGGARQAGESPASPTRFDPVQYLRDQGYTAFDALVEGDVAIALEEMASLDFYSSEISTQLWHTYYALNTAFPDAPKLLADLFYTQRYDLYVVVSAKDWIAFYGGKLTWDQFVPKLKYVIRDRVTGEPLKDKEATSFIDKNFGAGSPTAPNPTAGGKSVKRASSIKVEASVIELVADGQSQATITATAFDNAGQPLPDVDIDFSLSDESLGKLRPAATATDADGKAAAIFTAGKKFGVVSVRASAGGTSGTVVLALGAAGASQDEPVVVEEKNVSAEDAAKAQVQATLENGGYTVYNVGYLTDEQGKQLDAVFVEMDTASRNLDEVMGEQVALGWVALWQAYPDVGSAWTVLRYDLYLLCWGTSMADLEATLNGDLSSEEFSNRVTLVIIDSRTGQEVQPDDFANKNFQ